MRVRSPDSAKREIRVGISSRISRGSIRDHRAKPWSNAADTQRHPWPGRVQADDVTYGKMTSMRARSPDERQARNPGRHFIRISPGSSPGHPGYKPKTLRVEWRLTQLTIDAVLRRRHV